MPIKKPAKKPQPKPAPITRTLGERIDAIAAGLTAFEQEFDKVSTEVSVLDGLCRTQEKLNHTLTEIQDSQRHQIETLQKQTTTSADVADLRQALERFKKENNATVSIAIANCESRAAAAEKVAGDVNRSLVAITGLFILCVIIAGVALIASAF